MRNWIVIKRFATRINAEGFITEQRKRKGAQYHDASLLLVLDPAGHAGLGWLIIISDRE